MAEIRNRGNIRTNGTAHIGNGTNGNVSQNGHLPPGATSSNESLLMRFFNRVFVPLFLMVSTPNLGILFWYCNTHCDGSYSTLFSVLTRTSLVHGLLEMWSKVQIKDAVCVYILVGYSIWALILMRILPGKIVKGPITPKGNTPTYIDNGFFHYCVTMLAMVALTFCLKAYGLTPTIVYDRYAEIVLLLNLFSLVFCLVLYVKGRLAPSTTDCGSTGNFIFDYYWGTELYPRILGFDVKVFTNCRFGMTIWAILVFISAVKSYELHGVVDSMIVSSVLQLAYITKFFWWEAGYMRTIDIMVDRAGFYICYGCLVYIPSMYASVSLYLVSHPVYLGPFLTYLFLGCGVVSIFINYNADWQKQAIRLSDGRCNIWGQKPRFMRAKYTLENGQQKESILLTSGWWGMSRHFHYVPEIMLSFFWSVPALFDNVMPYSYVIYLTILLVHRSYRDDEKCGSKYGKFWKEYCSKVPYRIIPYLF